MTESSRKPRYPAPSRLAALSILGAAENITTGDHTFDTDEAAGCTWGDGVPEPDRCPTCALAAWAAELRHVMNLRGEASL